MSQTVAPQIVSGIVAQVVTPFTADASVDASLMCTLIDRTITGGVDAIELLGFPGEGPYLDRTEWYQTAATCVEHVMGRVPVILDVSDVTTAGAISRRRFAERLGVDAILVAPMPCWHLTDGELLRHFTAIAETASIPVMVGNEPKVTGVDLTPRFLVDLVADVDNITMIKESNSSRRRMYQFNELIQGGISLFTGNDMQLLHAYHAGATGWCTAASSLIPELSVLLWKLLQIESLAAAANLFYRLIPLFATIAEHGQPATVKSGLRMLGIDAGDPRLPQKPLDGDAMADLAEFIVAV
ncbi:dihydrodipicolinate synthase family protein [Nocardia sp. NPDC004573]